MKDILLSVIVPVFNTEKYIEKCIISILNQTFAEFELLIVNDGSTDNSWDLCNYWAKRDQRIVLISKKNEGLSSARNCGLKKARGKYISFIDSDDWIENDMFNILISDLITYGGDIAGCNMYKAYENGQRYPKNEIEFEDDNIKLYYDRQVLKTFYKLFSVCNKLFKKELFSDIKFPYGKIYEDARIMCRLAAKSTVATFNAYNGYNYLQRDTGITGAFNTSNYLDKVLVWDELYMFMKPRVPEEMQYIIGRKNKLIIELIDSLHENDGRNKTLMIELVKLISHPIIFNTNLSGMEKFKAIVYKYGNTIKL